MHILYLAPFFLYCCNFLVYTYHNGIGGACCVMITVVGLNKAGQVQILCEAVCISHSTNNLGKAMHPTILLRQTRPCKLGKPTGPGERKLSIQTC